MKGTIVNALTIDVEDYFQVSAFDAVVTRESWGDRESRVVANTDRILDLLAAHDVKGTFFVLGWVADRFPALVRRIADQGHEVASHSYWHRLVYDLTPDQFREDVRLAKRAIEDAAGAAVHGYRAPSFSITARSLWALDVLAEEGHSYDASTFPIRHDRYGIPGGPRHPYRVRCGGGALIEAPASTTQLAGLTLPIAGGGYFRLLPYAWTRRGIERVNRDEGQPAIFYLHPWEVDPGQPRLPAGRLTRFRHYFNLHRTASRLEELLRQFPFGRLGDILPPGLPFVQLPVEARAVA
jgi:polysaccharide deacetylase family protein (PEP-CTERM system associated)